MTYWNIYSPLTIETHIARETEMSHTEINILHLECVAIHNEMDKSFIVKKKILAEGENESPDGAHILPVELNALLALAALSTIILCNGQTCWVKFKALPQLRLLGDMCKGQGFTELLLAFILFFISVKFTVRSELP